MKKVITQFFKFGIVGVINTVNSWIVYYSLIFFNINYLLATTLAYFISSIIGYLLNNKWVFKKQKSKASLIKYYVVYISSYFLNIGCMYLLVDILSISKLIAPILTMFVTVPFNFIFSRLWVFKNSAKKEEINPKKMHTFAICAYKESPYLEECIKSLKNQTMKSNIIVITSTPNDHIKNITTKYKIKLFVRNGKSDIQDDWNFAVNSSTTQLITVAHQDDVYDKHYLESIISNYSEDVVMFCTDYYVLKNGQLLKDKNAKLKTILKLPLRFDLLSKIGWIRRLTLSLGNSINCPSVTYNRYKIEGDIFTSDLKFSLDWDTFLKLSKYPGKTKYIPKCLIHFRVHDGATTKQFIIDEKRYNEDVIMFRKMWPEFIVKIIMKFYTKSYDIYD